jgi:hypothetical protein
MQCGQHNNGRLKMVMHLHHQQHKSGLCRNIAICNAINHVAEKTQRPKRPQFQMENCPQKQRICLRFIVNFPFVAFSIYIAQDAIFLPFTVYNFN